MGKTKVLNEKNLQEIVYSSIVGVYCIRKALLCILPSNRIIELSAIAQNGEAWICPEEKE
jgi:hypothetical protein